MSLTLKNSPFGSKKEAELVDAIGEFYDDPLGFVLFAFEWGKGELEYPYDSPDTWQIEFLESLGKKLKGDPNAIIREATASGHGIGKRLSNQSITPTPAGNRLWGDIEVGDLLFGSDGRPTRVTAKHPGTFDLYRVTFDDGSWVEADPEHLWAVRGRQERRNKRDGWRTLTTQELLDAGVKRSNGRADARQWEIPVQGAAQFESRAVKLHPYFVGLWLGDGARGQPSYCKPFPELAERLKGFGFDVCTQKDGKSQSVYGIRHLMTDPVFQCYGYDRYIPDDYKFNTVEHRKELLRGLLDSDGEVHGSGSIGYASTSKRLVEDIIWLVRSLGGKAMLQPAVKQGWYPDEDGERVNCRLCYRATINLDWNPFTIEHRRTAYKPSEHRYLVRWIDSIEFSRVGEGHCVTVDAADHLYQAQDFIVTHNTTVTAWLIIWAMSTRPHLTGSVTANTMAQLNTKTWRELAIWWKRAINSHWFKWSATRFYHVDHPETWYASAEPNTEHNSEAFAGRHGRYKLILFDEASGIPDKIWDVTNGAMTDPRSIWCVFGNPTKNTGKFRECFETDVRWTTRHVDSRTSRFTDKKELAEQIVAAGGEDTDYVRVRIRGQFPRRGSLQFLSSELVDKAMLRELPFEAHCMLPVVIGVDVARYGDDKSVICIRQGRKVLEFRKYRGIDTMELAVKVVLAIKEFRAPICFVDGVGVGAGVVDRLRMLGYDVVEVNAGETARDEEVYANKRAEMWAAMRTWMEGGDIPVDPEVRTALIGVEYFYDDKERVRLERKKDMKKRGLESPDEGDALAHTFAEPLGDLGKHSFEPDDAFEPEAA